MRSKDCTVILFLLVCLQVSLNAKDYYVSVLGTDTPANVTSPGKGAKACRTIAYLVGQADLSGGDTVWIQAGTYNGRVRINAGDCGSNGNYVTFKSYSNDDVVITSTNADYPFEIYDSSNWTEFVKIDGSGLDEGHHLRISTTVSPRCLMIRYARNIWITHCEIYGAAERECIKLTSNNEGTDFVPPGTDDDTGSKNCIIEYCKIHNGADFGIKITGWGTDGNKIRYNVIYNNGGSGADKYGVNVSGSGYEANMPESNEFVGNDFHGNYSTGLQFTTTRYNVVQNNVFYQNGRSGLSLGTNSTDNEASGNLIFDNDYYGIECYIAERNRIFNNVIFRNSKEGLRIQGVSRDNEVYNNTIWSSTLPAVYLAASTTGTILYNNIGVVNGSQPALHNGGGGTATLDHNNWYRISSTQSIYWDNVWYTVSGFSAATGKDVHSISTDPLIKDTAANNFSLREGSPCIDAGKDLSYLGIHNDVLAVVRPQAAAWDMGAYEYSLISELSAPTGLRVKP